MSERLFEHVTEEEKERIKSGGNILYLILLYYDSKDENKEDMKDWTMIIGRQSAYAFIKDIITSEDVGDEVTLNVDKSLIYADNPNVPDENNRLRIRNGISVYKFVKDCVSREKVIVDPSFDIEEYHFEEDDGGNDIDKVL